MVATAGLALGLALIGGYLLGSIPFGLLIGWKVGKIDLREHGSGNIGATNVGRTLGAKWGFVALGLDALKGLLPVLLAPLLLGGLSTEAAPHLGVFAGVGAVLGHMFPCWLGFRGGKGVATALGVVAMLAPLSTLLAAGVFAVTFAVSRIVSLGSMLAAITFAVAQFWQLGPAPFSKNTWSIAAFSIAVPLLILVRHRENVKRLLQGTENRFGSGSSSAKGTDAEGAGEG